MAVAMLYCLPEFLPDELLYSVLAAWADRLPFQDLRAVLRLAFGEHVHRSIYDLPNNLSFFISQLPPFYNMTLENLILEHTMYPYYATTLAPERRQRLWDMMMSSDGRGIYPVAGISNGNILRSSCMRYCPNCITDDKRDFGRSYWHRLHQIPGVLVCPKHSVFLEDSNVSLLNRWNSDGYVFVSAERVNISKKARVIEK